MLNIGMYMYYDVFMKKKREVNGVDISNVIVRNFELQKVIWKLMEQIR